MLTQRFEVCYQSVVFLLRLDGHQVHAIGLTIFTRCLPRLILHRSNMKWILTHLIEEFRHRKSHAHHCWLFICWSGSATMYLLCIKSGNCSATIYYIIALPLPTNNAGRGFSHFWTRLLQQLDYIFTFSTFINNYKYCWLFSYIFNTDKQLLNFCSCKCM
jgi:hypothetical protein